MVLFGCLFGEKKISKWSEAKCKKLIKKLWRKVKIEKSRRNSIIRQSCAEIALLLKAGHHDKVFAMVEPLYKDMCIECAYHQVDRFSVQVYTQLPYISKNSNMPTEVNEAVSSLIFAGSMCVELHELHLLQILFEKRYGCEFVKANVELLPGNHVNDEMKGNLCVNSVVADDVKHRLISVIAEEYLQEQWAPQDSHEMIKAASEFEEISRKSQSSDCDSLMSFLSEFEDSDSTSCSTQIEDSEIEVQRKIFNWEYIR